MNEVPVLDLRDLDDDGRRSRFLSALQDALQTFGFVSLTGHGLPPDLLDACYAQTKALFDLPEGVKARYATPQDGHQRGWTPFGKEHAKGRKAGDLKEFWHVGRTLPPEHPLHRSGEVPPNLWPTELRDFRPVMSTYFAHLDALSGRLLEAIAAGLGVPPGLFSRAITEGNSVLRLIHYPPLQEGFPPDAERAAAHEDINLLTLLPVSTQPGLELLRRDGTWLAVDPPPGVLVCDTGDMMQRWTGGRLPATTHRVVNPTRDAHLPRYSMPFFCHPHPDVLLRPLFGEGEGITARDFLAERLRETGVAT